MLSLIVRRLTFLLPILLLVSTIVFAVMRSIPGDPGTALAGPYATKEQVDRIRTELGLDRPLYVQYSVWLINLARGDLGRSYRTKAPVTEELGARLPATVELSVVALSIAVVLGVIAGSLAAVRPHSIVDYGGMLLALLGVSTPVFWLGLLLMYLFAVYLPWLPIGGRLEPGVSLPLSTGFYLLDTVIAGRIDLFKSAVLHMILPAVTLATVPLSVIARITRASMLEILGQDYMRTAHAKGLPPNRVLFRHAMRNALIPIVTVIGISLGHLMAGAVLTETVFAWPGIGRYLVTSIAARDFTAIQAIVLFLAVLFVVINLVVDVLYAYFDPRIRYT